MIKTVRFVTAISCLFCLTSVSFAQFPGDGIPDVYIVVPGGETFVTTAGEITRTPGEIVVDTDGTGMVALLIEGPNLLESTPDNGDYLVGSTASLPVVTAPPPIFSSQWSIGYIAGKTQWVLTNPLETGGFVGVIAAGFEDPLDIFPNRALAFWDGDVNDFIGNDVFFATGEGGTFATNPEPGQMQMAGVSPTIPEPASMCLFGMAILGLFGLRGWPLHSSSVRPRGT